MLLLFLSSFLLSFETSGMCSYFIMQLIYVVLYHFDLVHLLQCFIFHGRFQLINIFLFIVYREQSLINETTIIMLIFKNEDIMIIIATIKLTKTPVATQ